MKLHVDVAADAFLAEFPAARQDAVLQLLRQELNELVDEADRCLALHPAARGLRTARDRAARSVLRADTLRVSFEVSRARVALANVELDGLSPLEQALERIALRTFSRPPAIHSERQAAPTRAAEGEGNGSH